MTDSILEDFDCRRQLSHSLRCCKRKQEDEDFFVNFEIERSSSITTVSRCKGHSTLPSSSKLVLPTATVEKGENMKRRVSKSLNNSLARMESCQRLFNVDQKRWHIVQHFESSSHTTSSLPY